MKKALTVLILMSLGLGGCIWGPGGDRGYGNRGEHFEHGDRGERGDRGR
jgi:hypothetical protein